MSFEIADAETVEDIMAARALFREYAASLGFDLCFQGFDEELAQLPGKYARPSGCLLLARVDGEHAGCVAVQPFAGGVCEMKRLYVSPTYHGRGIGLALARAAIREATRANYQAMRLDTIEPLMAKAVAMYRRLGFREIPPYRPNPIVGALYMELTLG